MYPLDSFIIQPKIYSIPVSHYTALLSQKGGALLHFKGVETQRGSGIFSDFLRDYAIPALTKIAPHIVRGVAGVIKDVSRGKNFKTAAKKRGIRTLKKAARSVLTGKGKRQVVVKKRRRRTVKRRVTKRQRRVRTVGKTRRRKKTTVKKTVRYPLFA